jgi:hypothetical protein
MDVHNVGERVVLNIPHVIDNGTPRQDAILIPHKVIYIGAHN